MIQGLDELLAKDGITHITDAIGQVSDAKEALRISGRMTD